MLSQRPEKCRKHILYSQEFSAAQNSCALPCAHELCLGTKSIVPHSGSPSGFSKIDSHLTPNFCICYSLSCNVFLCCHSPFLAVILPPLLWPSFPCCCPPSHTTVSSSSSFSHKTPQAPSVHCLWVSACISCWVEPLRTCSCLQA